MGELDRIRWQCRRGMLEIDLVLARFVARHLDTLSAAQRQAFRRLLDEQDGTLLDLVMGRAEHGEPEVAAILELVRAA